MAKLSFQSISEAYRACCAWFSSEEGQPSPASRIGCRLIGRIATGRVLGITLALVLGGLLTFVVFMVINLFLGNWVGNAIAFSGADSDRKPVLPQKASSDINESFFIRVSTKSYESGQTQLSQVPFYRPKRTTTNSNPLRNLVEPEEVEPAEEAGQGGVVIEEVRTLYIILENPNTLELFVVEIRRERLAEISRVVLDVAFYQTPGVQGSLRRVRWWEIGNIAPSNELARIDTARPFIMPSFPTSATAFTSWFKEHWPGLMASVNRGSTLTDIPKLSARTIRDFVSPQLESLLNQELDGLETRLPILVGRIISGWIQFITVAVTIAAFIVILCRLIVFVAAERRQIARLVISKQIQSGITVNPAALRRIRSLDNEFANRWFGDKLTEKQTNVNKNEQTEELMTGNVQGIRSSVWSITEDAARTILSGQPSALSQNLAIAAEREESHRATDRFFLSFLVGAIPAIGFIGTVIGIGLALGGTGAVLSDELARQQSGVSTVALALGLAFDTTLVALVLSIFVLLAKSWLTAQEELVIHHARAECRDLLSHATSTTTAPPVATAAPHVPRSAGAAPTAAATPPPASATATPPTTKPRDPGPSLAWSDNEVENSDPIAVPGVLPGVLIRSVVVAGVLACTLYFLGLI